MHRKFSLLKDTEDNEFQVKDLERREEEMVEKLKTTFVRVNEFAEQSSTFDNVTQSLISNINYSRKHLKPISKIDESKHSEKTTGAYGNETFDERQSQTGNIA